MSYNGIMQASGVCHLGSIPSIPTIFQSLTIWELKAEARRRRAGPEEHTSRWVSEGNSQHPDYFPVSDFLGIEGGVATATSRARGTRQQVCIRGQFPASRLFYPSVPHFNHRIRISVVEYYLHTVEI